MVGGAGLGRGVASHDVAFFAPGAAFVLATNTKLSLWLRRGSVRHLLRTWPTGQIYGHAWPKGSAIEGEKGGEGHAMGVARNCLAQWLHIN